MRIIHFVCCVFALFQVSRAGDETPPLLTTVPIDDQRLLLAPYVWRLDGTGEAARAEAAMPGAYLKATCRETRNVALLIDGAANNDCPASSMPVIEYSVDESAFHVVPLTRTGSVYALPLAHDLDRAKPHRLEIYFRAADLTLKRWSTAQTHLRLAGLTLDRGGQIERFPARPRRMIGFGDSILEGVGTDGEFTSWQSLGVNNARGTWLPIVAAALDCEYGQLGSGGQGMTRVIHLPALVDTWNRYDAERSRLTDGRLLPEPDYIFCAMGTNDYEKDITADYTRWLTEMREACPHAWFFCVVPPLGLHRAEILAAVNARTQLSDKRVRLIETPRLAPYFRVGQGATPLAYDGVHPSQLGHAMLAAQIAVEVQKALDQGE